MKNGQRAEKPIKQVPCTLQGLLPGILLPEAGKEPQTPGEKLNFGLWEADKFKGQEVESGWWSYWADCKLSTQREKEMRGTVRLLRERTAWVLDWPVSVPARLSCTLGPGLTCSLDCSTRASLSSFWLLQPRILEL